MTDVHGYCAPGLTRVRDVFAAHFEQGLEIGASFAAIHDDEIIVNLWGGHTSRKRDQAWERDTIAPVYSTTKAVAALVIAMLADRGALDWETPVSHYWPEFGAQGKDHVTIAQVLSHQAGVPGFVDPIDPALWLDPPALAAALAQLKPLWPPGTASGYHALTLGYIAAELVRRVSPRSLGRILREDVCAPHTIDFWIGLPDDQHARVAEIARPNALPELGAPTDAKRAAFLTPWSAPNRGGPEWKRMELPAANGHGNALSVAQLFGIFIDGALNGAQIISANAVQALKARRMEGPDLVLPYSIDWRTAIMGNSNFYYGPNRETVGHSGWGGSCGFADGEARLSAAYVMNKQSNKLMGDARPCALIDALYACM